MTDGSAVAAPLPVPAGDNVEVKTRVVLGIVEIPVDGEGVDVIVVSFPDMVVTMVVGDNVRVYVLSDPPDVDTKVRVIGAVAVGVITTISAVGVPPTVVVKLV